MAILWFILFLLSLAGNVVMAIGISRALEKTEQMNAFFHSLQQGLMSLIELMRQIDIRGSFESDDEVGGVFQQMKSMIEALDVYLVKEATSNAEEK
mgnify:CR=1 FL=1